MFAMQNLPEPPEGLAGLTVTPVRLDRGTCRYDLHIRCYETPEGLSGWLEYSTALFGEDGIRRRLGEFLDTVRDAVVAADRPIGDSAGPNRGC
jgi:hypothetical protein